MLSCQKSRFNLADDITYINCAYMSPLMDTVSNAGKEGISLQEQPYRIRPEDFFYPVDEVRKGFSQLINSADFRRTSIIPSASYGIASAVQNCPLRKGQNIVIIEEQFPSNYYAWHRAAKLQEAKIRVVASPQGLNRAEAWNSRILEAIDQNTSVVTLPQLHWADGCLFDLVAIREKTKKVGALMIIDGTQSIGAYPFDLAEIEVDALVVACYKWLLGPYSIGLAYYGPAFDSGIPIEESWINRKDSMDFQHLVNYQEEYQPMAGRYSVGEHSNFTLIPMVKAALDQLLEWGPAQIQDYCRMITKEALEQMKEMGCWFEGSANRGEHLFGIRLSDAFDRTKLMEELKKNKVFVSLRGNAIRISPHLYNDEEDMALLLECFNKSKR